LPADDIARWKTWSFDELSSTVWEQQNITWRGQKDQGSRWMGVFSLCQSSAASPRLPLDYCIGSFINFMTLLLLVWFQNLILYSLLLVSYAKQNIFLSPSGFNSFSMYRGTTIINWCRGDFLPLSNSKDNKLCEIYSISIAFGCLVCCHAFWLLCLTRYMVKFWQETVSITVVPQC